MKKEREWRRRRDEPCRTEGRRSHVVRREVTGAVARSG
jgi:hypothetical protein